MPEQQDREQHFAERGYRLHKAFERKLHQDESTAVFAIGMMVGQVWRPEYRDMPALEFIEQMLKNLDEIENRKT